MYLWFRPFRRSFDLQSLHCQLQGLNPPANYCQIQYRNDNFFYVPIALVMVLLDIFPLPSPVLQKVATTSKNAISLGIFW